MHERHLRHRLGPSGQADAKDDVVNRPWQVFSIACKQLYDYLREMLRVPVYLFGYDWRISCLANAQRLLDFFEHLSHKPDAPKDGRYHVICHSMGGLLLRAALKKWSDARPHRGALDAVDAMIRGESLLFQSRKDMRKVAGTMPSVYELLPVFAQAVVKNGRTLDIHKLESWQEDVIEKDKPHQVSARHLQNAKIFHQTALLDPAALEKKNVLQIYGFDNRNTLKQVPVKSNKKEKLERWYDFDKAIRGDGDGVVLAQESALIAGLPAVRIKKSDISWYEIADQFLVQKLGFHGFLPAINEVHNIIGRFLKGESGTDLLPRNMPKNRYHIPRSKGHFLRDCSVKTEAGKLVSQDDVGGILWTQIFSAWTGIGLLRS